MENIPGQIKLKFKCNEHQGYDIIAIIVSDNILASKRLCCQKCMIYTYRGVSTDQFILLEDLLDGKEQASAYFLPICKKEQELIQEAIIKSLDNGYLREVEQFFGNLQKQINQKINDKKKEALLKAEEKQQLIEDLRLSFNRSEKLKELQGILLSSFTGNEDISITSEKIDSFIEKHKNSLSQTAEVYQSSLFIDQNPANIESQISGLQQENQIQQGQAEMSIEDRNLSDIDFYQKFKNFRKKDFQIKVNQFDINIIPVYDLNIMFVKSAVNDLILGKNTENQATITTAGGFTATCKSDYIIRQDRTHVFTFQFSAKPSDYMRIGIAKKTDDAEDRLCQCFGWSNNFDLSVEKGDNLSNQIETGTQIRMEVNISQNVLKFSDLDQQNIAKKKTTFNLEQSAEYVIIVYFHSDLKIPLTLTLVSAELID